MLNELLIRIGHNPIATAPKRTTYKSPFTNEKTPSFFVFNNQRWNGQDKLREYNYKCNSTGVGGNIFDFAMRYYNLDFKSAKRKIYELLNMDSMALGDVSQNRTIQTKVKSFNQPKEESYKIKKTQSLQNKALVQYLEDERKISFNVAQIYISEIYYQIGDKNYFALCFYNNSGGMEIRNKYFKGSFGKKDIATITPFRNQTKVKIFEGFLDFLSYIELNGFMPKSDYIILNSLSLLDRALNSIKGKYGLYELYYDNDRAGNEATQKAIEFLYDKKVIDKRDNYQNFKDLNEFLISKK